MYKDIILTIKDQELEDTWPLNSEMNEKESLYAAPPEGPLCRGYYLRAEKHITIYRLNTWKEIGKKNNTFRRTRQMVSVLNPDKLAVNIQVFEKILRQWKYLVKLFVLLFSSAKHLQHRFVD